MKDYIAQRAAELAHYIVDNNATVRKAAGGYNVSKSTVHKDVHVRLRSVNPALFREAGEVLERNKAQRHLRGGMATKEKYLKRRIEKEAMKNKTATDQ